jgi:hypothetical protein
VAPIAQATFARLLAGCPSCGRGYLRLEALGTARLRTLGGEPVSSLTWTYSDEALLERLHRIVCSECDAVLFERDDCPLCRAPGKLAAVLHGSHGLAAPPECPRCGLEQLDLTVEARLVIETLLGRQSRRRAAATLGEGGLHVVEASCPDCEEVVASAGSARCAACGRSSLLKKIG